MQFKQKRWLRKKSNICVALPSLGISRTAKYAAFLGILRALILNFLLCHPKIDFLRDCQISKNKQYPNPNDQNSKPRGIRQKRGCFKHWDLVFWNLTVNLSPFTDFESLRQVAESAV